MKKKGRSRFCGLMKLIFTIVMFLIGKCETPLVAAEPEKWLATEKGITSGRFIPGSTSPDGKHALYEFNFSEGDVSLTANGIGLAPVDRSKLLFVIDSRTEWMTDKKVTSFLTVMWTPGSSLLATHDTGSKHSKVRIYRIHDGAASSLEVPDLLNAACARLAVTKASVSASGEIPSRWLNNQTLEVTVRLTAGGRKLTARIPVRIADDRSISLQ
jgi:hypothetical protein